MNKLQNIGDHVHNAIHGTRDDFYDTAAARIEEARKDQTCKACIVFTIRDDGRDDGALEVATLSSLSQSDLDAFVIEMANAAMARRNPEIAALIDLMTGRVGDPAGKADDRGDIEALRDHAEDEDQNEEEVADIIADYLNEDPRGRNPHSPWHKDDKQ